MASTVRSHRANQGSIPCIGVYFCQPKTFFFLWFDEWKYNNISTAGTYLFNIEISLLYLSIDGFSA